MNKNFTFSYEQVQELLPDYAFGRLDKENSIIFENSIELYPDLKQELNDVREVFSKAEMMEYDQLLSDRSKNISVKVNNRFNQSSVFDFRLKVISRYVAPLVGVAAIMLLILNNNNSSTINLRQSREMIANPTFKLYAPMVIDQAGIELNNPLDDYNLNPANTIDNELDGMSDDEMYSIIDAMDNMDFDS